MAGVARGASGCVRALAAAGTLGKDRQIARRAAGAVPVRPRREASRAAVRVAPSLRGPDRADGAGDVLGERLRHGPASGEAPRAEQGEAGSAGLPVAPLAGAEEAMVGVGLRASAAGRVGARSAPGDPRQRHGGPEQQGGDGSLAHHVPERMQAVPGARLRRLGRPDGPIDGTVPRADDGNRHATAEIRAAGPMTRTLTGTPRRDGFRMPAPPSSSTPGARCGTSTEIHKTRQPAPLYITEAEARGVDSAPGTKARRVGDRLPASYVNFHIGAGIVVMPWFDDPRDGPAQEAVAPTASRSRSRPGRAAQPRDSRISARRVPPISGWVIRMGIESSEDSPERRMSPALRGTRQGTTVPRWVRARARCPGS
jgi:peptidyl-arginine deiminase